MTCVFITQLYMHAINRCITCNKENYHGTVCDFEVEAYVG